MAEAPARSPHPDVWARKVARFRGWCFKAQLSGSSIDSKARIPAVARSMSARFAVRRRMYHAKARPPPLPLMGMPSVAGSSSIGAV